MRGEKKKIQERRAVIANKNASYFRGEKIFFRPSVLNARRKMSPWHHSTQGKSAPKFSPLCRKHTIFLRSKMSHSFSMRARARAKNYRHVHVTVLWCLFFSWCSSLSSAFPRSSSVRDAKNVRSCHYIWMNPSNERYRQKKRQEQRR